METAVAATMAARHNDFVIPMESLMDVLPFLLASRGSRGRTLLNLASDLFVFVTTKDRCDSSSDAPTISGHPSATLSFPGARESPSGLRRCSWRTRYRSQRLGRRRRKP